MKRTRTRDNLLFFLCLIITICLTWTAPLSAKPYTITVKADTRTQHWNRYYEKGVATCHMNTLIDTYWKRSIGNALKIGHEQAGFQYFRGHGILHSDIGLVDTNSDGTLKLNWTRFDAVYTTAINAGLRPIVEISTTPPALASGNETVGDPYSVWYNGPAPNRTPPNRGGWDRWVALMDSIVTHCKATWGEEEVRNNWFFEVWNEPEWWYLGFEYYNELYSYTAKGLKLSDPDIKVGGPACGGNHAITGSSQLLKWLDHCHSGNNPATGTVGTPVDFITYHWYANNTVPIGITGAVLNANNLSTMHKKVLDTLRTSYPWFKGPVFIDEVGPTSRTIPCRDMASTASWLAKTVHLLNENGPDYPPPAMLAYWTISDLYEEFYNKAEILSFQEGNYGMLLRGDAAYPNSWDIPKPVFQAYRLLHQLGDFEVASTGGTTEDGVNVVATCDSSNNALQILLYNHMVSETQSSQPADEITLTVNNIPWTSGKAVVTHQLIDTTHSNAYTAWVNLGKPPVPTNAQWDAIRAASALGQLEAEATVALTNNSFTKTFNAHYYSVHLITLVNPESAAVKKPSSRRSASTIRSLKVTFRAGECLLATPFTQQYTANLFTTDGRKVLSAPGFGTGEMVLPLPKLAKGTYVLRCHGIEGVYTKQIVVE